MMVLTMAARWDGEDGGGVIVPGGIGHRPALGHAQGPRRRQGPDQRGIEPARRQDRWPGALAAEPAPAAPATDLGGGGKIAGDPVFDVKEIGVALDQLAREILRHLKDHKVTVVWLFDESISHAGRPEDDRREVRPGLQRAEAVNVDPNKKASAGALNHAIVGFGQGIDFMLEKPRDDIDLIGRAIKNLRIDPTGIENTMTAIREVAERYARLVRKDRKLMIVLVTDESGDDGADVEEARQALKRYNIPLYVIGRQSLFGYPVRPPPLRGPGDP